MYINNQPLYTDYSIMPLTLKEWLEYEESLTAKLISSTGSAQLELLFQNWILADWWTKYVLQIHDSWVFVREIVMKNNGIEYWYARTIIPQHCYHANEAFFNRLNNESIRNLIFDEPRVQRINRYCYPVNSECIEYQWVKKYVHSVNGTLWVRLAEYSIEQSHSFYLLEILLPPLENIP